MKTECFCCVVFGFLQKRNEIDFLAEKTFFVFFLFRTDWIYSEKYDRQNASIQRSIQRTAANRTSTTNEESTA